MSAHDPLTGRAPDAPTSADESEATEGPGIDVAEVDRAVGAALDAALGTSEPADAGLSPELGSAEPAGARLTPELGSAEVVEVEMPSPMDADLGDPQGGPPTTQLAPRAEDAATPIAPWAERLVRLLDDGVRLPGTNFRFGLDPILGFFLPTAGDVVTGLGSISLLVLAIQHRVPTIIIGRMVINIAIDTMLGSIPIVGDVFDLFFRSNRKNLELVEKFRDDPNAEPSALDYLLVGTGVALAVVSIALPLLVAYLLAAAGVAFLSALF